LTVVLLTVGFAPLAAQTDDPAYKHFHQAVARYVEMVRRLHREVPELRVTPQSQEINNRSDMLAGAIQRARRGAAPGDLLDAEAARVIRVHLARALEGRSTAALLKRINDEPVLKGPPSVHLRFPVTTSLAQMPAQILQALPPLPKELEYRFVGRALVLRDRDAALVVDYLPDALPQK
jgi:hypothetical protein